MSIEKALRKLKEEKERREKDYIKFKGFADGIRTGSQLNQTDKDMLRLFEHMYYGFKNAWDDIIDSLGLQLSSIQRISSLETRVSDLETNILQLRQTLDKMVQDK